MAYDTINYELRDRVAWVTLNRPDNGNALNEQMHHELRDMWLTFNRDDDAWVAVLQGAGEDFCIGEDVHEINAEYEAGGKVERWELDERWQRKASAGLEPTFGWPEPTRGLPGKPVIVGVRGRCHGAGMMFLANSDFAIASETAEFSLPNVHQGTVPVHEALLLSRTMLRPAVARLALLGKHEHWDATRARELGLVIEALPDDQMAERLDEIVTILTTKVAPLALRASRRGWWMTFESPLHESDGQNPMHNTFMNEVRVTTWDAKEGPRSFAQKRAPRWRAN